MTAWLIGVGITILCRLVPLIIGLRFWRRYNKGEKALIILFGYDIIATIIGAFLAYYYRNNLIMSNIYAVAEVLAVSWFFNHYFQNVTAKKIIFWFPLLFAIMQIITSVYFYGIHSINPAGSAIKGIFIIALGSFVIGPITDEPGKWYTNGAFWIVLSWLSFYLINIGYLTMSYWLIETNSTLIWGMHKILVYSFYVMSVLFVIGFYLIAKERKKTSMM